MTIQYNEGRPSLEEISHSGVKGMKWGRRKSGTGPSSAPNETRQIHDARDRVHAQGKAIKKQRKVVKKTGRGQNDLAKMEISLLRNPDRVTAAKLTKGEDFANLFLGGPVKAGWERIGSEATQHIIKKQIVNAGGKV